MAQKYRRNAGISGPKSAECSQFFPETTSVIATGEFGDDVIGGEAQRVKLASHLAQSSSEGTLFLFDEPTTGLHFDDIRKLLDAFQRLIHNGGSILLIEHNLDAIRATDWVIELGPEGGAGGRGRRR